MFLKFYSRSNRSDRLSVSGLAMLSWPFDKEKQLFYFRLDKCFDGTNTISSAISSYSCVLLLQCNLHLSPHRARHGVMTCREKNTTRITRNTTTATISSLLLPIFLMILMPNPADAMCFEPLYRMHRFYVQEYRAAPFITEQLFRHSSTYKESERERDQREKWRERKRTIARQGYADSCSCPTKQFEFRGPFCPLFPIFFYSQSSNLIKMHHIFLKVYGSCTSQHILGVLSFSFSLSISLSDLSLSHSLYRWKNVGIIVLSIKKSPHRARHGVMTCREKNTTRITRNTTTATISSLLLPIFLMILMPNPADAMCFEPLYRMHRFYVQEYRAAPFITGQCSDRSLVQY
eukprot:sb/3466282/